MVDLILRVLTVLIGVLELIVGIKIILLSPRIGEIFTAISLLKTYSEQSKAEIQRMLIDSRNIEDRKLLERRLMNRIVENEYLISRQGQYLEEQFGWKMPKPPYDYAATLLELSNEQLSKDRDFRYE